MKNMIRIVTITFLLSTVTSQVNAITYKQWQGITGLGAVGGAIVGIMIYQAMADKEKENHHHPEALVIGHHKPKKKSKKQSLLSTFCAGALGAASGALTLGWWFWGKTPQARQEQAQGLIHLVQANRFIAQDFNVADVNAVQARVRELYVPNGEEFRRALWEMTTYQRNLEQAQNLCAQALADAQDDGILQATIGQTQVQVNDLLNRVIARAGAIRNNPAYQAQIAAAAERDFQRELIWQQEFERAYMRDAFRWRWRFVWPQRPVHVVHREHVIVQQAPLPRPPVVIQPAPQVIHHEHVVIHQAPVAPRPPVVIQPAPVVTTQTIYVAPTPAPVALVNAPRPPYHHHQVPPAPARPNPAIPYPAPAPVANPQPPAPLQKLIVQAAARQQKQQPYQATQGRPNTEIPFAGPVPTHTPPPPALQRLIMQADGRQRGQHQQPFHAPQARANPMHPSQAFGRGKKHFNTL